MSQVIEAKADVDIALKASQDLISKIMTCRQTASESQRITSPSGVSQSWMIDLRHLFLDADALRSISTIFWNRFSGQQPFQIGAMETAAIPLLTALLLEARSRGLSVNGFIIRKERKATGLGRWIEGVVTGEPIMIVDDILNSGASVERARRLLSAEGWPIAQVFVVIDYKSDSGIWWRNEHEIAISSLFDARSLGLKTARRQPSPKKWVEYRPLWRFRPQSGNAFYMNPKSTPLLSEGCLFIGTDNGKLYCLNADTGTVNWSFEAPGALRSKGIWSSPCMFEGRLFFGAYNGNLYAIGGSTGDKVWETNACEWIGSSPTVMPAHRSLVVGLEYERPSMKGSMAAFSIDTGEKLWEHWLKQYQHGSATYWPERDLLICGTNDHTVEALRGATGETVWQFNTRRSVKYAPALDKGRNLVAFASFDASIYILRASTGEKLFELPTDNTCYTTPLFAGHYLFCGSGDRHLYVIDVERMAAVKRVHTGARVYGSPRAIGGNIIVGTCSGLVFEMSAKDLAPQASLQVNDAVTNAVAISPDEKTIFVPTYMNEIHAFTRTVLE